MQERRGKERRKRERRSTERRQEPRRESDHEVIEQQTQEATKQELLEYLKDVAKVEPEILEVEQETLQEFGPQSEYSTGDEYLLHDEPPLRTGTD